MLIRHCKKALKCTYPQMYRRVLVEDLAALLVLKDKMTTQVEEFLMELSMYPLEWVQGVFSQYQCDVLQVDTMAARVAN